MSPHHDLGPDLDDVELGRLVHRAAGARAALAPDAEVVHRRVEVALGRRARRRRAAAAGGAALAVAGLVGGLGALDQTGVLSRITPAGSVPAPPASPAGPSPSPAPTPSPTPSLTQSSEPPTVPEVPVSGCTGPVGPEDGPAVDAFVAAGYTFDDAWNMGYLWQVPTCAEAKVAVGERLVAGEQLPVAPGSSGPHQEPDETVRSAFFDAGYDSEDAADLAELWGYTDLGQAKLKAGRLVLEGAPVPVGP